MIFIVSITEHHSQSWCFEFISLFFFFASALHREEQTRCVSASNVHTENGGPVRLRSQGEFSKYWCRGTSLWVQLPTRFSLTRALFEEMSLFLLLWWITQVVFFISVGSQWLVSLTKTLEALTEMLVSKWTKFWGQFKSTREKVVCVGLFSQH